MEVKVKVAQSCLTLCNPRDCSLPGSSVHRILQARILEWVAIPFSRGSSQPRIEPRSPSLQADSLLSEPPEKPKVNLSSFKLAPCESEHIISYDIPVNVLTWLCNQCFQLCPVTRRIDSHWTYVNNYLAMKIRISNRSFHSLGRPGRKKKINVSFLFIKVQSTKLLRAADKEEIEKSSSLCLETKP